MRNKLKIPISNFYRDNNIIYFISSEINIICSMNMETFEVEFIAGPPDETFYDVTLYGDIKIYDTYFFLVPYNAKNIWRYNRTDRKWDKIVPEFLAGNKRGVFTGAEIRGEKLYAFGFNYPNILCIDLKTLAWHAVLNSDNMPEKTKFAWGGYVRKGDVLYFVNHGTEYILKLDLNSEKYEWIKLEDFDGSLLFITYDDENFWLISDCGRDGKKLIRWNKDEGITDEFGGVPEGIITGVTPLRDNILIYGPYGSTCLFNKKWAEFESIDINKNITLAKEINRGVTLICNMNGEESIFYTDGKKKDFSIVISEEMLHGFEKQARERIPNIVAEGDVIDLRRFLAYLCESDIEKKMIGGVKNGL